MPFQQEPWTLLGIERNASEREIKSAYARLLKITRPDEDAEAFQRLVEARDSALAYARHLQPPVEDHPSQLIQFDFTQPAPTPDTVELEFVTTPEITSLSKPMTPVNSIELDRADIDVGQLRTPVDEDPSQNIRLDLTLPDNAQSTIAPDANAPSGPIEPAAAETDVHAIIAGLGSNADQTQLSDAIKAINTLSGMSIAARRGAELQLLHAISPLLPVISSQLLGGRETWLQWLAAKMKRKDEAGLHRLSVQFDLILMLNEEFGWTNLDRWVPMFLGRDEGAEFIAYLNAMQRASRARKESEERGWRSRKPRTLDEIDARSYFRSDYTDYAPFLVKMRSGSHLPVSWQNLPVLLLPLWALARGHYRVSLLWLVTSDLAWIWQGMSYHIVSLPFDWLRPVIGALGVLPLLALHLWAGAYSYKWDIQRAFSKVAEANRKKLFDPSKRDAFLRQSSGHGSLKITKSMSNIPWWLWVVGPFVHFVLKRVSMHLQ